VVKNNHLSSNLSYLYNMKNQIKKLWPLAALAVVMGSTSLLHADSWGVKYLGRTASTNDAVIYGGTGPTLVTNTAGVVPIPGWNNITNYLYPANIAYTNGIIYSSDGSLTATLTISGSTAGDGTGGWQSGSPNDGGDGSLANGYVDLGANIGAHAMTNIISGLPGTNYILYVYIYSDASHPGNGGDYLPNYSANGIIYYAPQYGNGTTSYNSNNVPVGGPFTGWRKAKATLVNYNTPVGSTNDFGSYLEIDNVHPVQPGGVVTFIGQANNQSWRSPLDGFELVQATQVIAPSIDAQTPNQTNFAGSTVQVQVVANGTPLNFQWEAGAVGSGIYTNLSNGGQFSGVNAATLVISNFTPLNVLDYIVVITNSAGSVTSAVPTTLSIAPMSTVGPTPAGSQVYPGESASFSVLVNGSNPLTYQWLKNGAPVSNGGDISGANTNTLVISNAAPGDVGSYALVATNGFASVTSSPALFGLAAAPVAGSYAQSIKTNGAVAFWRLSENDIDPTSGSALAYDFIGGRVGAYGASTQNGFDSIAGPSSPTWPGFEAANYAVELFNDGFTNSYIEIPASEALNMNTNTVTITAWINPTTLINNSGIVLQRQVASAGLILGTNGNLGFNWNNDGATWGWDSGLTPPLNQWSFVALVVSPTQTTIYTYNANTWTNAILPYAAANASFTGALDIGNDTSDGTGGRTFNGDIDEVAIFNIALTPAQVAKLASVASGVTLPPLGSVTPTISIHQSGASLQITWTGILLQSTSLLGPWTTNNATSPLIVTPSGPQQFYRAHQ
jgi:hypothetical protein